MRQKTLDLNFNLNYLDNNFIVGGSNCNSHTWIKRWPEWPHLFFCIFGPSGCGKTHLAKIWQNISGAEFVSKKQTMQLLPQALITLKPLIIKNPQKILPSYLLKLITLMLQSKINILFISNLAPRYWFDCKKHRDLYNLLLNIPTSYIDNPDDELLDKIINSLFKHYGLKPNSRVFKWLILQGQRSIKAMNKYVEQIYNMCRDKGKNPTLAMAKQVLKIKID